MKPHKINKDKNFIAGWYMKNTYLCDEIIKYFDFCGNKHPGHFSRREGAGIIDKKIKDSVETNFWDQRILNEYYLLLGQVIKKYIREYPACDGGSPWQVLSAPNIQYYPPKGGYFEWHTERYSKAEPFVSRHLVFMTYLNDVKDKGETQFKYQNIKVKPEKGLTLIWPVDWTHLHRGIASPTQKKYVVTGWFNYI